jgi:phosphoglycolate phosphatase
MIKLIIFDWDDVITLGSKEGYFKCYHETMADLGVVLDMEEERKRILAKWGKSQIEELRELLKERPEMVEKAHEIYERKLFGNTFVDELRINDGTIELLQKLNLDYKLCVATAANPRLLKEVVMPKFNIPQVFSQIIFSCEISDPEKQKPHPYMLEEIMRTQRMKPEETILVGDSKAEVIMARNASALPVVVLTGHLNREEAEELNVESIIEDVTYLPGVLEKIDAGFIR